MGTAFPCCMFPYSPDYIFYWAGGPALSLAFGSGAHPAPTRLHSSPIVDTPSIFAKIIFLQGNKFASQSNA